MKKESNDKKNRLFLWVTLAFVIQIMAWCVFVYFAEKSKPQEVPLEHLKQSPAVP